MQSAGLELVPDQPQAEHPAAEGVLFVVGDCSSGGSLLLRQGLVGNGKAKLYVGFNLSSVGGGVKQSKLDRAFGKGSVKVQSMVAGVVVMVISAVWVFGVPNVRKLRHGRRLLAVDGFQQFLVGFFAVAKARWFYLQGFVQDVFLACHDVDEIAQGLRCEPLCPDMNVDSAGGVYNRAFVPKLSDQFLHIRDVLVGKDGADHFGLVLLAGANPGATHLFLGNNAGVVHSFPGSSLRILSFVGLVGAASVGAFCPEVIGNHLARLLSRDACHFDFDPKFLRFHAVTILSNRCVFGSTIYHSKSTYYQVLFLNTHTNL